MSARGDSGALLLHNPEAGSMHDEEAFAELASACAARHVPMVPLEDEAALRSALARAEREGRTRLVVAGGDGTIHRVVAAILEGGPASPALGIVPMGTGNDLSRALALPGAPGEALARALEGEARAIDIGWVHTETRRHPIVNVAAGGFASAVDRAIDPATKDTWGTLSYLRGALSALSELEAHSVRLSIDGEPWDARVFNVVVANGRFAGAGVAVAPTADLEDGLLDLVLIREDMASHLPALAARIAAGEVLSDPDVVHRMARRIELAGGHGLSFNVDGELLREPPLAFEIEPGALKVVVGESYRRDPLLSGEEH